ncbi:MAG: helix-turn-helix domain-containing protein [Allomuricauda sp.]|uniref:Helix-turn-helix domain-containing protein n=1 Tax=Flagellimonas profundi TaxID=2915620 RepID=A0ABS3FDY3_9FLAO|nr:AraC family transcriptional regulator [Allomuricauda profundi]MBO0341337.1 helix-turn-helix domain-containing protein [Allomuricauda profundi]
MEQLFNIFRFTTEDAKALEGKSIEPHVHDFEELIIGSKGKISHFIDFEDETVYAPFVSFVTRGKPHLLRPQTHDDECDLWVIRFRSEFMSEVIFKMYGYFHNRANVTLPTDEIFDRLTALCQMMYDETQRPSPGLAVIKQLFMTLLTIINHERPTNIQSDSANSASETYTHFLHILEENFRRNVKISFYAEKLFMSERNLNIVCHEVMQQSAGEIIETRKLTEAKNLLINSNKTIAEIGFELGYNEKAYFSKVFKRKTGHTPTAFRKEMKQLIS